MGNLKTKYLEFYELVTPDGVTYKFNLNTTRFVYASLGEGLPRSIINSQSFPGQDGVTPIDFRLEPRSITMTLRRQGKNRFEYFEIREELIDVFRLNRQTSVGEFVPSVLRKKLPNGDIRDINVYLETGLLFEAIGTGEFEGNAVIEVVKFFCPDPVYFNPTAIQETISFEAITDLIFPVEAPIAFGGGGTETDTIAYSGNYRSFPTIIINGPARNPTIINLITGKKIELNFIIGVGDTITVVITNSAITITDAGGVERPGILSEDSDPDFAIVPAPLAPLGVNSISASASSTSGVTSFLFNYLDRHYGF